MEFRKNKWRLFALLLLILCIYSVWTIRADQRTQQLTNQDFIRFHVIANSDSDEDQALKLKVRDGLLEKINGELVIEAAAVTGGTDRAVLELEQSREYIIDHLEEIREAAAQIIEEEGYTYGVKAELGERFVPEKSYGNLIFPAGNYEALNVTIGSGEGHNWWCVLFPPLCLIGAEAPEEMESDPLLAELYLDPRYRELLEAARSEKQTTLKLEFKTLDYLERID